MESTRFVNTQFLILGESACANPSYSVADPYPICKRGECRIDALARLENDWNSGRRLSTEDEGGVRLKGADTRRDSCRHSLGK